MEMSIKEESKVVKNTIDFNSEEWKLMNYEERAKNIDKLRNSQILNNKNRDEVINILGLSDWEFEKDNSIFYRINLGTSEKEYDYFLYIKFDENQIFKEMIVTD